MVKRAFGPRLPLGFALAGQAWVTLVTKAEEQAEAIGTLTREDGLSSVTTFNPLSSVADILRVMATPPRTRGKPPRHHPLGAGGDP